MKKKLLTREDLVIAQLALDDAKAGEQGAAAYIFLTEWADRLLGAASDAVEQFYRYRPGCPTRTVTKEKRKVIKVRARSCNLCPTRLRLPEGWSECGEEVLCPRHTAELSPQSGKESK